MNGDILRNYGPDRREDGKRATNGGQMEKKELPYSPPTGPKGQTHNAPGLGGTNHGCCGTQGRH
jgi:hypothetical protein